MRADQIRSWHTYLGVFIAPSVLFFAVTGALQIFSLHESHGSYSPPALLEKLSSLHKDQVLEKKHHDEDRAASPEAAGAASDHPAEENEHEDEPALHTLLLKWYFLSVATALSISTLLGLWMGLTHVRRRRTAWWLLALGAIIPAALALL
jgi:hypothetical protein